MDITLILQGAAALALVLALIMGIAWAAKRHFGGAPRQGQQALRRRNRRLGIIEAAPVGGRHRLVLVRRDDVEHLLLIGGATEVVVETGIPHRAPEVEAEPRFDQPRFAPPPPVPSSTTPHHEEFSREPLAGYEERTPRGFARDSFERRAQQDYPPPADEFDDSGEAEYDAPRDLEEGGVEERRAEFALREPDFERDEPEEFRRPSRPEFEPATQSPALRRIQREGLFPDRESTLRSSEPNLQAAEDDEHEYGDLEARDRYGRAPRDADEDPEYSGDVQSRILNRFLKREEN